MLSRKEISITRFVVIDTENPTGGFFGGLVGDSLSEAREFAERLNGGQGGAANA